MDNPETLLATLGTYDTGRRQQSKSKTGPPETLW
jgi:hypothetical protein